MADIVWRLQTRFVKYGRFDEFSKAEQYVIVQLGGKPVKGSQMTTYQFVDEKGDIHLVSIVQTEPDARPLSEFPKVKAPARVVA